MWHSTFLECWIMFRSTLEHLTAIVIGWTKAISRTFQVVWWLLLICLKLTVNIFLQFPVNCKHPGLCSAYWEQSKQSKWQQQQQNEYQHEFTWHHLPDKSTCEATGMYLGGLAGVLWGWDYPTIWESQPITGPASEWAYHWGYLWAKDKSLASLGSSCPGVPLGFLRRHLRLGER